MCNRRWLGALAAFWIGVLSAGRAGADAAEVAETFASGGGTRASATETKGDPFAARFGVMAGLSQWILFRGGNLAVEYETGRFGFEISHGQGLDFDEVGGFAKSSAERSAGAHVRVPWTTGFGAGVRILPDLMLLWSSRRTTTRCADSIRGHRSLIRPSASARACSTAMVISAA